MKNILLSLLAIFAGSLIQAQPAGWEINSADYEYSMTFTAFVEFDDTAYNPENDYMAAFVDGDCRGLTEATWVESYDKYFFFLTVFSNDYSGEEINFQYYSAVHEDTLTEFLPDTFSHGDNLGSASDPYILSTEIPVYKYSVTFIVDDGTDVITGAEITIDGSTLTTDSSGKAVVELPDGEYSYTINAEGFNSITDTLTVTGSEISTTITISKITGIHDKYLKDIKIYPNPANEFVIIQGKDVLQVELINMQGQVIKKKKGNFAENKININDLNPGLYILNIHSGKEIIQKRKLLIH